MREKSSVEKEQVSEWDGFNLGCSDKENLVRYEYFAFNPAFIIFSLFRIQKPDYSQRKFGLKPHDFSHGNLGVTG